MMYYPQYLIEAYALGDINRKEFIAYLHERQKISGLDYTCKGTADKSGVYLTYRGTKATIKDGLLHFKTNQDDTANTPFEFRRKVDFYKETRAKGILRAMATTKRYMAMADEAFKNEDDKTYKFCLEKATQWAKTARERSRI